MSLTVTPQARDIVKAAIERAANSDPVVNLVQCGGFVKADEDILRVLNSGDKRAIRKLAKQLPMGSKPGVVPAIFSRSEFSRNSLIDVDGMTFCLPPRLQTMTLILEAREKSLFLVDSTGAVVLG